MDQYCIKYNEIVRALSWYTSFSVYLGWRWVALLELSPWNGPSGSRRRDGVRQPPWDSAFPELHFGEISLASIEESYFREKTLSNSLLYYFKDISQDDINILFFILF